MASPDVSQNAGDEIDVDDATTKQFIERKIASKLAKETAEKKAMRKRKAVKT